MDYRNSVNETSYLHDVGHKRSLLLRNITDTVCWTKTLNPLHLIFNVPFSFDLREINIIC